MSTSQRSDDLSPEAEKAIGDTRGHVRSVARALNILKVFRHGRAKATLAELARASQLAPSTTLRIVQTLEDEGFLSRLDDSSYTCGPALVQLGLVARNSLELVGAAGPHLERLARSTGETTNLGVPDGEGGVLYVDSRPSSYSLRAHSWLGRTVPQEGTAIGAAIRGDVNRAGWVIALKTLEAGVTALAAPVFDPSGTIAAAINITGPSERVASRCDEFAADLSREAMALTESIGGRWPYSTQATDPDIADADGESADGVREKKGARKP